MGSVDNKREMPIDRLPSISAGPTIHTSNPNTKGKTKSSTVPQPLDIINICFKPPYI